MTTRREAMEEFDDRELKRDAWRYVRSLERCEKYLMKARDLAEKTGPDQLLRDLAAGVQVLRQARHHAHQEARELSDST